MNIYNLQNNDLFDTQELEQKREDEEGIKVICRENDDIFKSKKQSYVSERRKQPRRVELKYKNKFMKKSNLHNEDQNFETLKMHLDDDAKLIQESKDTKKYEYVERIAKDQEERILQMKMKEDRNLASAMKNLEKNIDYIKTEKEIEIEIQEGVEDAKGIMENTHRLMDKLNFFDDENRQSKQSKKKTHEINCRNRFTEMFKKKIREQQALNIDDKSYIQKLFKKKSYLEMQKEYDRKKNEESDEDYQMEIEDEELDEEKLLQELIDKENEAELKEDDNEVELKENDSKIEQSDDNESITNENNDNENDDNESNERDSEIQNDQQQTTDLVVIENEEIKMSDADDQIENSEDESEEEEKPQPKKLKKIAQIFKEEDMIKKQERIKKREEFEKNRDKFQKEYFEMEAELGSDNEFNDHVVKKISKNDIEEREQGLDVSDEELIDRQNEIVFVQEDEYNAHKRFIDDLLQEDERQLENVWGKNFKNDSPYDDHEYMDEINQRRQKLDKIKQMNKFLQENTFEDVQRQLQKQEKQDKFEIFGLEIDEKELEELNGKREYTLQDYLRDMETLMKNKKNKIKLKKSFFKQSHSFQQTTLNQAKKQVQLSVLEMKNFKNQKGVFGCSPHELFQDKKKDIHLFGCRNNQCQQILQL